MGVGVGGLVNALRDNMVRDAIVSVGWATSSWFWGGYLCSSCGIIIVSSKDCNMFPFFGSVDGLILYLVHHTVRLKSQHVVSKICSPSFIPFPIILRLLHPHLLFVQ